MDRQYDFAALEALLKKRSFKALREALLELNEVDIAEFLGRAGTVRRPCWLSARCPRSVAADVFARAGAARCQQVIVAAATDAELAAIVEDLYVDDAVDMLEEHARQRGQADPHRTPTPETRGADQPVSQVSRGLRRQHYDRGVYRTCRPTHDRGGGHSRTSAAPATDRETIYTCYVIDAQPQAAGRGDGASILLLAPDDSQVVRTSWTTT